MVLAAHVHLRRKQAQTNAPDIAATSPTAPHRPINQGRTPEVRASIPSVASQRNQRQE
jgi:hypothetical protein